LLDYSPKIIESFIIDYVRHLKDSKQLKYRSKQVELSATFIIAYEDNGSGNPQPFQPTEIESGYEEHLESTGATVHSSITYYPASRVTTNKRGMTYDEVADQRGYLFR
jgi:hypothetical protein